MRENTQKLVLEMEMMNSKLSALDKSRLREMEDLKLSLVSQSSANN